MNQKISNPDIIVTAPPKKVRFFRSYKLPFLLRKLKLHIEDIVFDV